MYLSVELIAIIVSSGALLLSFFGMFIGGFAWMISRTDAQFEHLGTRIGGVEQELVEVKIAVARIEGPPRRLQTSY